MSLPESWTLGPDELVTEAIMALSNSPRPVVFVEGDSDRRFFRGKLRDNIYYVDSGGRINVKTCVGKVNSLGRDGDFIGVVDEDYDWILGGGDVPGNIIKFDPRDLECLLLRSRALDNFLVEYSDDIIVSSYEARVGCTVREAVASKSTLFGAIRIFNSLNRRVDMKWLRPSRFLINGDGDWSYDVARVCECAVENGVVDDSGILIGYIDGFEYPSVWHVVRGHDAIEVFRHGVNGYLGRRRFNFSADQIESFLRQAFDCGSDDVFGVFKRLHAWGESAGGVQILSDQMARQVG